MFYAASLLCAKSQTADILCFAGMLADSSAMIDGHQVHLDPKQQTGINFTIKSRDEAILLIEDEVEAVKFKVGIGASQNSVTWLSRIKSRKRISGQKGMFFTIFSLFGQEFTKLKK